MVYMEIPEGAEYHKKRLLETHKGPVWTQTVWTFMEQYPLIRN